MLVCGIVKMLLLCLLVVFFAGAMFPIEWVIIQKIMTVATLDKTSSITVFLSPVFNSMEWITNPQLWWLRLWEVGHSEPLQPSYCS